MNVNNLELLFVPINLTFISALQVCDTIRPLLDDLQSFIFLKTKPGDR